MDLQRALGLQRVGLSYHTLLEKRLGLILILQVVLGELLRETIRAESRALALEFVC